MGHPGMSPDSQEIAVQQVKLDRARLMGFRAVREEQVKKGLGAQGGAKLGGKGGSAVGTKGGGPRVM